MPSHKFQYPKKGVDRSSPILNFTSERNRPNRSGLDVMDSYRELYYTAGHQFRTLILGGFQSGNVLRRTLTILFVFTMIAVVVWSLVSIVRFVVSPPIMNSRVIVYPTIEVPSNSVSGQQPVYFKIEIINVRVTNRSNREISFTVDYSYEGSPGRQFYIGACLMALQSPLNDVDQIKNGLCAKSDISSVKRGLVPMTIHPNLSHPQSFDNLLVWISDPYDSYQDSSQTIPVSYDWHP